jgi:apolipoprotein N-acyltransferase
MPGVTLLGKVPSPVAGETLYTRTGDLFGWLCTAAAVLMLVLGYRRRGVNPPRTPRQYAAEC